MQNELYKKTREYTVSVELLEKKASNACQDWTSSPCETAIDLIPALEIYAKIRATDIGTIKHTKWSARDKKNYQAFEDYRKGAMGFWKPMMKSQFPMYLLTLPGHEEMKTFSTFHWAINMTNNRCTSRIPGVKEEEEEAQTYTFVLDQIRPMYHQSLFSRVRECIRNPSVHHMSDINRRIKTEIIIDWYQFKVSDEFPRIHKETKPKDK